MLLVGRTPTMFLIHLNPSWGFVFLIPCRDWEFKKKSTAHGPKLTLCPPCCYLKYSSKEFPSAAPPSPSSHFFFNMDGRKEQLLQVSDAGSALLVPVARAVISGPRGSMRSCVLQCRVLAHLDMKEVGHLLQRVCSGCYNLSVERRPHHI